MVRYLKDNVSRRTQIILYSHSRRVWFNNINNDSDDILYISFRVIKITISEKDNLSKFHYVV